MLMLPFFRLLSKEEMFMFLCDSFMIMDDIDFASYADDKIIIHINSVELLHKPSLSG